MRLPELTSRIRQALLDRHAQVNQVEALMAARKAAASRDRRLDGHAGDALQRVNRVRRKENPEPDQQSKQEDGRQAEKDPDARRGRFVDVEV